MSICDLAGHVGPYRPGRRLIELLPGFLQVQCPASLGFRNIAPGVSMVGLLKWIFRSPRAFLGVVFRLSIPLFFVGASLKYVELEARYRDQVRSHLDLKFSYECAARIPDAQLLPRANNFGNIDVQPFGCATRPFIVALYELQKLRRGEPLGEQPTIDWPSWFHLTGAAGLGWFLATNFAGLVAVGLWYLGRWIVGR